MTLARLGGVSLERILNQSGPVPPDGMDVWDAVTSPTTASPRTMIVHEFDPIEDIYAVRSGDWKLIWGKSLGNSDWIPDVSYDTGCSYLLPPVNTTHNTPPSEVAPMHQAVSSDQSRSQTRADVADTPSITCTAASPCLFNVVRDPTEHEDPLHNARSNPDVVRQLQQQLAAYTSGRYTGGLDQAVTTEDAYCRMIKATRWVHPYDDGVQPSPPPPPSPVPPLPPAVVAEINGTWCQGCRETPPTPEWMAVTASVNNDIVVTPINCTGCCWTTAKGSASADGKTLTLVASGKVAGKPPCTKDQGGTISKDATAPGGYSIVWTVEHWKSWIKLA